MNGEIWELWSTRTGNLMEEFATEAAALAAVAQIITAFGPASLDAVVLFRGPISGEGDRQPGAGHPRASSHGTSATAGPRRAHRSPRPSSRAARS